MTYLYKPLIRKNFKTGEKMYYPAPYQRPLPTLNSWRPKSARSVPSRVQTLWAYSKNLNDKSSTRCSQATPFDLALLGRSALLRSQ